MQTRQHKGTNARAEQPTALTFTNAAEAEQFLRDTLGIHHSVNRPTVTRLARGFVRPTRPAITDPTRALAITAAIEVIEEADHG